MSEALIAHLAPFAEAEGLTVWQVAEMVKGSPYKAAVRPAWRAIFRFCRTSTALSISDIARMLGREKDLTATEIAFLKTKIK